MRILRKLASRINRRRVKALNDVKYARTFTKENSRENAFKVEYIQDQGFLLSEGGMNLIIARRSRLHYYENGLNARLSFLYKEYLGTIEINLKDGDIIIDCGANIGEFSRALGTNSKHRLFAFEPDPVEYKALTANLIERGCAIQAALWHSTEALDIFMANEAGDTGVYARSMASKKQTVKGIALDDFLAKNAPHGTIRLMKIEAEGSEPEVLLGAEASLGRTQFVAIDVGPERGQENETTLVQCTNILLDFGFRPREFNPTRYTMVFENKNIF